MENTLKLTGEVRFETYEKLMQKNQIREEKEFLEIEYFKTRASAETKKRFWDAVANITGKEYPPDQRLWKELPFDVMCKAFDGAFGKEGAPIKPSHSFLPYSLIKNRDLAKYVPEKSDQVHGDVLRTLLKDVAVRSLEVIREYTSENTKRAFNGDIIYLQAWLSTIGFNFKEPISEGLIKLFIVQHIEETDPVVDKTLVFYGFKTKLGTHSLETVKRRLASLSVCLDLDKQPNPCRNKDVKLLLKRFTKMYGGKGRKKKAITKDILDDMLLTCGRSPIDIRDKAVLLFAFSSGGRRRCEIINADMSNLTETPEGDYLYNLRESKTNQTGEDDYKPIKGRAAKALRDWFEVSEVKEGAIFRSVGKGGNIKGSLSGNDIRRLVKKRARLAGYDENQFSAHSLRRGFVTEGAKQGKPLGDIMKMTSHRSVSTVMKYYEAGSMINNSCAELAG